LITVGLWKEFQQANIAVKRLGDIRTLAANELWSVFGVVFLDRGKPDPDGTEWQGGVK